MASGFVAVAIWVFVTFAAGAAIGLVVAVAVAIRQEERRMSLRGAAPSWLSGGARRVNGVFVRNAAETVEEDEKELIFH
jgi:hypothetical protein